MVFGVSQSEGQNPEVLGQDPLHTTVGVEGLALLDANGRQQSEDLWVLPFARLCLNHGVDFFPDPVIHAVDRIVELPGGIDEVHLRRVIFLR